MTVLAVCGALLGTLVAAVATRASPFALDTAVHEWVLDHRPAWARQLATIVTDTGSGAPAYALAALAGTLAQHTAAYWRGALAGVLALASAQVPRMALASALVRPRPPSADWAATAGGWSMPSGHTTTSMVVALLLTLAVHRRAHGRVRPILLAVPAIWATAVGLTRIYLGMHWPTDVAAGWLLAACWAASATLLVLLWRRRADHALSMERQYT
ncbi:phosphatase PAP2 family protein [Streptomyces sp. NPDC058287]|uniref:phosphatase PAP2 family protein n=1 Tax=unclassified Streptomyces TaxID=2593676 RepID=UPI0036E2A6D9